MKMETEIKKCGDCKHFVRDYKGIPTCCLIDNESSGVIYLVDENDSHCSRWEMRENND